MKTSTCLLIAFSLLQLGCFAVPSSVTSITSESGKESFQVELNGGDINTNQSSIDFSFSFSSDLPIKSIVVATSLEACNAEAWEPYDPPHSIPIYDNNSENSYYVKVKGDNWAGSCIKKKVVHDSLAPPEPARFNLLMPTSFLGLTGSPILDWSPVVDLGAAGISHYEFRVVDAVTNDKITSWSKYELGDQITGLSLLSGHFYVEMRAVDSAGNRSRHKLSQELWSDQSFSSGSNFIADTPTSVAPLDVDNDGDLDILMTMHNGARVQLYVNQGNMQFENFRVGSIGRSSGNIQTGDLNGDGYLDFASAGQSKMQIGINDNGNNFITSDINLPSYTIPGITIADLNNDGYPEIIYSTSIDNSIYYLLNNAGSIDASSNLISSLGEEYRDIEAVDINEDGFIDILALSKTGEDLHLLINNGDMSFTVDTNFINDITGLSKFAVGKFNSNSFYDFIFYESSSQTYRIYNSSSSYSNFAVGVVNATKASKSLQVFDQDQDGIDDVVSVAYKALYLLDNDGAGVFTETSLSGDTSITQGVVVDLDQDGDLDLIDYYGPASASLSWKENVGVSDFVDHKLMYGDDRVDQLVSGDFNEDGKNDVIIYRKDKILFLNSSGGFSFEESEIDTKSSVRKLSVLDLDSDGHQDLIVYLQNEIFFYKNDGTSSFTSSSLASGGAYTPAQLLKVDGDNFYDLVFYDTGTDTLNLIINDGSNGFGGTVIQATNSTLTGTTTHNASDFAVADMDKVNGNDIVVSYGYPRQVFLLKNDGSLNFSTNLIASNINAAGQVRVGDLNGDGWKDIVVSSNTGLFKLIDDGTQTYTSTKFESVGHGNDLHLIDTDSDGDLDVISVSNVNGISRYRNDGTSTFTELLINVHSVNVKTKSLIVEDFNGDSHFDYMIGAGNEKGYIIIREK